MFGDVLQVVEFTVVIEGAVSAAKFINGAAFQAPLIGEACQFCDGLVVLLLRPALLPLSAGVNSFRCQFVLAPLKQSEERI